MNVKRQALDQIASSTHPKSELPRSGNSENQPLIDDERYPGSFFRVPGVPMPGKTTWSLNK